MNDFFFTFQCSQFDGSCEVGKFLMLLATSVQCVQGLKSTGIIDLTFDANGYTRAMCQRPRISMNWKLIVLIFDAAGYTGAMCPRPKMYRN